MALRRKAVCLGYHSCCCPSVVPSRDLSGPMPLVVRHQTIIIAIHQGGGNHEIGGGAIAGNGNIPHDRHAQERLDIRIVGLRFERIPEEDEEVDLAVGDLGADLLIARPRGHSGVC